MLFCGSAVYTSRNAGKCEMITRYFSALELVPAAQLLQAEELVSFPTETVYGLGANALNASAVKKIFVAKGRPSDNPLIVHIADFDQVSMVAREVPPIANLLMQRFWPGPLTIVLPKRAEVAEQVTAGLDTVAVRLPNHSIALELIRHAGFPLAAPSANRSGRPSATTWQAVAEDLDGRIAGLVCGEPTQFGLESTVVDATADPPRILRPGGVSLEQLQEVCAKIEPYSRCALSPRETAVNSPGLKYSHYQPRARVIVVPAAKTDSEFAIAIDATSVVDYVGINAPRNPSRFRSILVCSNASEYAAKLFDFFRKADLSHADVVCCEAVDEIGIGVALLDRLRRASQ